jgi:hypothetical protein
VATDFTIRRVTRELRRLEALAARRRLRVRVLRALRGLGGAGATFAALVKLKLAASLGLKLGLAALVGLGLVWPFVALAILALMGLVVAILALIAGSGEAGDLFCPDAAGCERRERRAARLKQLIATRRAWLDAAADSPRPPA